MHRDVDKILDEIIEKKRNSGYGIIWEELFREDYKKAYEKAKADYVAAGNKKINAKDVKVYVKPEESMAYYVINGDFTGNFEV